MSDELVLRGQVLDDARATLNEAHLTLARRRSRPVESVQSEGSVGAEVDAFLSGVETACASLSESASAQAELVLALLATSDQIDSSPGVTQ